MSRLKAGLIGHAADSAASALSVGLPLRFSTLIGLEEEKRQNQELPPPERRGVFRSPIGDSKSSGDCDPDQAFGGNQKDNLKKQNGRASTKAKPEMLYPEATAFKSTRPTGSGDLGQHSTRHTFSGFAVSAAIRFSVLALQVAPAVACRCDEPAGGC